MIQKQSVKFRIISYMFLVFSFLFLGSVYADDVPRTIKIGTITDQTGPMALLGAHCRYGYLKAAEAINREGGIFIKAYNRKIPVEILFADHEGNEQKSITAAEDLYQRGAVVLSGTTAISPYGITVAEKNRIPLVISNAQAEPFQHGFKYTFCMYFQNDEASKWPFDLMEYFPDPKPVKIGFMEEQNVMGMDYSLYFHMEANRRKITNFVVEKYQRYAKDFSASIRRFKREGVDLVYAPMLGPDGILFWKQMKELDFVPKAVLMPSAPAARAEWLSSGKDADYVFTINAYHWAVKYAGSDEFENMYRADHKGENPTELAGNCYAMMQVIKFAIEEAGSLDREKIRDKIAVNNINTIMGNVSFNPNGMNKFKTFIVQYIDGVERVVWPKYLAEREPVYPFPAWTNKKR